MKKNRFLIIFLCIAIFTACSSADEYLREALVKVENIDYSDSEVTLKDIETINELYDKAIQCDPINWDSGYYQKSQFLRILFLLEEYITESEFLNAQKDIYEEWFSTNPADTTKKVTYAMTLYLQKDPSYVKILEEVYDKSHTYTIDSPTPEDFFNFVAGVSLNKIVEEDFYGTPYESFLMISDEEILNNIIGF